MKYFAIFDKNVETIFQLQWKIGNIPDMFLHLLLDRVPCGINEWVKVRAHQGYQDTNSYRHKSGRIVASVEVNERTVHTVKQRERYRIGIVYTPCD